MKITNFEELVEALDKTKSDVKNGSELWERNLVYFVIDFNRGNFKFRINYFTSSKRYFISKCDGCNFREITLKTEDPQKILDVIIAIKNCED